MIKNIRLIRYSITIIAVFWSLQASFGQENAELTKSSDSKTKTEKPEKGEAETRFVRVLRDEADQPAALQTSITSYETGDGIRVDLVGAIHVGEASYYANLNQRFLEYDAVLYELVAPEGTRIPSGGGQPTSGVSYLQTGMTDALGLAFQLEEIDYQAKNFVHADMTPSEFSASMKKKGESVGKMFFRMLGQSIAQQAKQESNTDLKLLTALLSNNRELELRRVLAEQFSNEDGAMLAFNGPDGSTLITERNKKSLRVLRKELKKGKQSLAIFYGAGHMEDMSERLVKDFGMKPVKTIWLTAWRLQEPESDKQATDASK